MEKNPFFVILFGSALRLPAQFETSNRKVEFRTNLLADALMNYNLGIRIQTKTKWKPDISVSYHLPITNFGPKFAEGDILGEPILLGGLGNGILLHLGLTRMEPSASGKWSNRFGLFLTTKANETGNYDFGYTGSGASECGRQNEQRITIGPTAIWSSMRRLSDHMGLELSYGMGVRMGVHRLKIQNAGTAEYDCADYNYYYNYPEQQFGRWEFSFVPAIHAGLAIVVW